MAIDGAVNLGDADNLGIGFIATPLTLSAAGLVSAVYDGSLTLPFPTLSGSLEGPKALKGLTLSATGVTGFVINGAVTMRGFTAAGTGLDGRTAVGAVTLPGMTLAASTGTRANISLSQITVAARGLAGTVSKGGGQTQPTMDGLTLSGTMRSSLVTVGDAPLLELSLDASGITGNQASGSLALLPPQLAADSITGTAPAGGDLQFLGLTLLADIAPGNIATATIVMDGVDIASAQQPAQPQPRTGAGGDLALELLTLDSTLLGGTVSDGSMALREPTLSAVLANSPPMSGDLQFAEFTLAGSGLSSNAGGAVIRLPEIALAAAALTGNSATASIELPLLELDAQTGILNTVGTASFELPLLTLSALAQGTTLPGVRFTGIALNSRTKAVSEYTGLAPNSIARFNGVTLMATAQGIVALQGATDQGAHVDAHVLSAKTDLGNQGIKRVLTGYVGLRADGDLEMSLIADDHHENIYPLRPLHFDMEQHRTRAKFGRGVKGNYWQWKIANKDGADFALDHVELHPTGTGEGTA